MFREMRRKNQALSHAQNVEILENRTAGVLALLGDDDYPYAVPLSYFYCDDKLYFHGAMTGHKIDALCKNDKASFCVIDKDTIVPAEYTSYFRSVIAFGKVHLIENAAEKRAALTKLAAKYSPDHERERLAAVEKEMSRVCLIVFDVEHLTGKAASELFK
ncbi:MAG: pyridoxamine 5'-phosphate oxidase family protein [Ruthenibacterium sp.]